LRNVSVVGVGEKEGIIRKRKQERAGIYRDRQIDGKKDTKERGKEMTRKTNVNRFW